MMMMMIMTTTHDVDANADDAWSMTMITMKTMIKIIKKN